MSQQTKQPNNQSKSEPHIKGGKFYSGFLMEGNTVTWNWEWVQGNLKNRDIEGNLLQPRMVDIFGTYLNKFLREIEKNKRLKERAPGQT